MTVRVFYSASPLKIVTCGACAIAVGGMCAVHALQTPSGQHQSILFYQDHGHPEPERTPQPEQVNRLVAPSSSSVIGGDTWPVITGNPATGNFSLTYINHEGKPTTIFATRPTDFTLKS